MRLLLPLALAFGAACAAPAYAQEAAPSGDLVTEKVTLTHARPSALLHLLFDKVAGERTRPPEGIRGILVYELDNSLVVRGTPDAVRRLRQGVRAVDTPFEEANGRAQVTLKPARSDAAALAEAVLRLPAAGSATVRENQLELSGSSEWVRLAMRRVIEAEMAADVRPPVGSRTELTFPADADLKIEATEAVFEAAADTVTFTGRVVIHTQTGWRLEAANCRVVLTGLRAGKQRRLVIEPAPAP